jgi:transposase
VSAGLGEVIRRLEAIEQGVRFLLDQRAVRDFYSIAEFARIVGRSEFTCREWCRLGRIKGLKKRNGRGLSAEWVVSHEELLRFQREGLLPLRTPHG